MLATTCLQAQNLYVQQINGERIAFSIVESPRITFGNGTMTIQGTIFQLTDVQNLSFIKFTTTDFVAVNFDDKIIVFPNPVRDELTLIVQNPQGLNFGLFDMLGRELVSDQIRSETTRINMHNFRAGVYVLHIIRNGQTVQSFQIVKQ